MKFISLKSELFLVGLLVIFSAYDLITTLAYIWDFTTDDSYISWIYARQLVNGNGLQWHVALPLVEGYSNFLWIIIAAIIIKLKLPLVLTTKIISCCSLGAGLFFLYRLGRLFFSPLLSILPVFIFSHFLGVSWWTISGMESIFYCSLSLLLIWQCSQALGYKSITMGQSNHLVRPSTTSWFITNCVLLLLCLTRFEGLVWLIPVLFFLCCQIRNREQRSLFAESGIIQVWILITFCCFLLPYTIYFIWRLHYFGHWIPNSYICKALAPGQFFVLDYDYFVVLIPLLIASIPYFLSSKDCRHWLLWLPSVIYAVLLWKANPVIAHFLRLFLGPLALFCLLAVLGVIQCLNYFKQHLWDPKLSVTGIIILLTFLFIPGNDSHYLHALLSQYSERTQMRLKVVEIINAQASKNAMVLFGDCGIVPFMLRDDISVIDVDCLNNAELSQAPYNKNLSLYAEHIATRVKPEWVITSYIPLQQKDNYLFVLLRKNNFFADYQLVTVLKSGWINEIEDGESKRTVDYIYHVYKRRVGVSDS